MSNLFQDENSDVPLSQEETDLINEEWAAFVARRRARREAEESQSSSRALSVAPSQDAPKRDDVVRAADVNHSTPRASAYAKPADATRKRTSCDDVEEEADLAGAFRGSKRPKLLHAPSVNTLATTRRAVENQAVKQERATPKLTPILTAPRAASSVASSLSPEPELLLESPLDASSRASSLAPTPRSSSPESAHSSPIASFATPRAFSTKQRVIKRSSSPMEDVSAWTPEQRRVARAAAPAETSTITTPGGPSTSRRAPTGPMRYRKPPPQPAMLPSAVPSNGQGKLAPLPAAPPRPAALPPVAKAKSAPVLAGAAQAKESVPSKAPVAARPALAKAASTPVAAKKAPAPKRGAKLKVGKKMPKDYARWLIENRDLMCRKNMPQEYAGMRVLYLGTDRTLAGEATMGKMRVLLERGAELLPEWDAANPSTVIVSDCREETSFMEKMGIKSLDEVPRELPIVTWEWALHINRPHYEFPSLASRMPIVPGFQDQIDAAAAKLEAKRAKSRRARSDSPDSSRESSPEPEMSLMHLSQSAPAPDPLAEFYDQARAERTADQDPNADLKRFSTEGKEMKGFLCDGAPKLPSACPNQDVIDKLTELQNIHRAKMTDDDKWRVYSYSKALRALKTYPTRIRSEEQAMKITGVGEKTAQKIMEIIHTGELQRTAAERTPDLAIKEMFQGVYGVGAQKAHQWYLAGARTLDDLREGKYYIRLTEGQKLGLKYYDDINTRMPREEAGAIFAAIKPIALQIDPKLFVEIMGSYRRRKETCGDIDVLISRPKDDGRTHAGVIQRLLDALHAAGILTEDLSLPDEPRSVNACYRGLCVLPGGNGVRRRIDILAVPWESRGAALIYYTGDDIFNRSMRLKANKMGYSLNQLGLFKGVVRDLQRVKTNKGTMMAGETEGEIFQILGVPWQEPWERARG